MRREPQQLRLGEDGALEGHLDEVVRAITEEPGVAALTGAGISVESGIPDFRSDTGLWSRFEPMEYATLSCFLARPEKAWELYRELGRTLIGKRPNPAHDALAALEREGKLAGIVTQNVDGLHQTAGSRHVLELHGEHTHLQCLECGRLEPMTEDHLEPGPVPICAHCDFPLKPNVVLFEEAVRELEAAQVLIGRCRILLVVGTSAEVAPASLIPETVLARGGSLIVFDLETTRLCGRSLGPAGALVRGPVGKTLPCVTRLVLSGGA